MSRVRTMRGFGIGLTACLVAGCGSISASNADAGAGGNGMAGHGGSGGAHIDGGAGVGGGDGGNRDASVSNPVCPKNEPTDGTTCPSNGLLCEYGTDPRGDTCRDQATCIAGRWAVAASDPTTCPSIGVTTCSGNAGSACTTNGTYCTQSNGVDCECTNCPSTAPVCVVGSAPTLSCRTSSASGCPAAEPNLGTSCGNEGLTCSYCPDESRVCAKGLWTPSTPCPAVR